jgi:thiosulfate/3-mercaptopyruvate sulfurtransferase
MLKVLRSYCLFVVTLYLLLVQPLMAADAAKGNLVDVDWLAKHVNDSSIVILDASPAQVYATKHIAGAVSADLYTYGVQDMPVADTEQLFQSWGVSPGKKIVLYDQGGSMMATRIFFSLVYAGVPAKDMAILDGGLSKWQEKGQPVTTTVASPQKGSFKVKKLNEDVRVRLPEFLTASGDPANSALVEALTPSWHYGEIHPFDRAGHVPHAVLMPSTDFYNADKTFKSADEISRMVSYLGVNPQQRV